ncbi:MAG: chalcone isomerase family protein [Polyangiales bacterium]
MCSTSRIFAVLSCLLLAPLPAVRADRVCDNVRLPEQITAQGTRLVLNGMGIRRATFLKVHVYVAGLYVPQPSRDVDGILQAARPKQLTLHFLRDVSRGDMMEAIRDGLKDNAGPRLNAASQQHVQNLERLLPNLHSGTVLDLSYQPKRGLRIEADGHLIGVENDDAFANLLFHVWLGPKPPDDGLKQGLLGRSCD